MRRLQMTQLSGFDVSGMPNGGRLQALRSAVARHPGRSTGDVPELSRFFGIVIGMFYKEHGVPHFHAVYGSDKASFAIMRGRVLEGTLPPRACRLVVEWTRLHERELLENWERARRGEPLQPIQPLE